MYDVYKLQLVYLQQKNILAKKSFYRSHSFNTTIECELIFAEVRSVCVVFDTPTHSKP